MDSEHPGRRFSPQNQGPSGHQSCFRFGIHFSNAPADVHPADLEGLFSVFGECRVKMDPVARHGWVGYNSIQECNDAFAGLNPNEWGMYIRKGPYEAGPLLRPPMGRPPMGRSPMGGPPMGGPPMGRPLMGGPPMGGQYMRNMNARIGSVPRHMPDYYEDDDFYDYNPYMYGFNDFDEMYLEQPACDVGPCTMCGARTSYSCERCGAFYCSEICQRRDWSMHRELCDKNIPSLNFGPRHRPGSGDIRDERLQRLPVVESSYRPSGGNQEGRIPTQSQPSSGDRPSERTSPMDRRQSGGRVDDRRPDGEFKWQRRGDAGSGDKQSESAANRGDNAGSDRRRTDGFAQRNDGYDRRPTSEKLDDGFVSRRVDGDSWPTGSRRNDSGFGDRRGDGDSRSTGERRNEGGFGDRRGDGDRRQMGDRRQEGSFGNRRGGNNRPMGERRNENGFGDRLGGGDSRPTGERRNENSFGDRRPIGERRSDNAFGDRRQDEKQNRDRKPSSFEDRPRFGEDKKSENGPHTSFDNAKAESPKGPVTRRENTFIAVAGSDIKANAAVSSLLKKCSGADVSQTENKSELLAEKGVCVDLKMNDTVVITNATAVDCIYVTPPISAISDDFKKVISGIALHCKDSPPLDRVPTLNEVVACQFTFDNDFYRAVVKETLPGGEYLMQFCDYGNVQKCKIDILKAIPNELKKCPWNAVKVSLSGVKNVPIAGPIQRLFVDLIDNEVNLKLQFDGDISKGVVLLKPSGESVNDEVNSLIRQAASPVKKDAVSPKIDIPAPKVDAFSPPKESVASVSSVSVEPRSPDQVLSSLLKMVSLPNPEPPTTYPAEEGVCIQLKNDETVVITASTGTGSTYITRATESSEMLDVAKKLNEQCKTAPPLGREPREKEVVACQFVDELYYRAFVSEVLPNAEYVMTFCDYGNVAKHKAADLKAVPNELKVLPRQAVQVYFRDVDPVPVTGQVGEILHQLSNTETQLRLRFGGSIENGVELIRPDGKSVNEELRSVIAQVKKPVTAAATARAEPAEDFSPAASVPLPTDKPFTLLVFGILGEFLVAACNADAPEIEQFEKTCAPRIAEYCEKTQEKEHRPEPGEMCLAKFNDDWYRALAMSYEDDGTRDVFFVDYGNTSKVKPTDIRKIPHEIRSQLHTLTLCSIVGIRDTPDNWTKIKTRLENDINQRSVALFSNVTAVLQTESTAEVTIPELKAL